MGEVRDKEANDEQPDGNEADDEQENGMNEDDEDSGFRLTVLIASLILTV